MSNLTLAKEGTSFFGDGVNLSWPKGGRRPVVPGLPGLSLRVRERIANGYIVETDDVPNRPAFTPPASRIVDPDEVRQRRERRQAPGEVVLEPEAQAEAGADPAEPSSTTTTVATPPQPVITRSAPTKRRSRTTRGG